MLAEIARALERRDGTEGHGARVAALAEPVAERLGLPIEELRLGARLHDIGKVAVRGSVLRKSTPLSPGEIEEIQRHPWAGVALVEPLRSARAVVPYVLFHHERWDGRGYPNRLSGRSIPIEGRVLCVADAFDAMTSPRPYRATLTHDTALAELARCAGSQFDPHVVEAFVDAWSEPLRVAV